MSDTKQPSALAKATIGHAKQLAVAMSASVQGEPLLTTTFAASMVLCELCRQAGWTDRRIMELLLSTLDDMRNTEARKLN